MKKLLLIVTILFTGIYTSDAQKKDVDKQKPAFKFSKETYDFGDLTEGEVATHDFEFKNIGKEPLVIKNVVASCGCTTPKWSKEPIQPGEKGVVTVSYNTKGRPTPFSKNIIIYSNAEIPQKVLYIKGNVKPKA